MVNPQNTSPTEVDKERGERIGILIKKRKLQQDVVAYNIGYSSAHMSKIINKGAPIKLSALVKLSAVLNTSTDFILTGQELLPGWRSLSQKQRDAVTRLILDLS